MRASHLLTFALLAALAAAPVSAAETAAAESGKRPKVKRIGPNLYRVGAVTLESKKRALRCPGRVNMSEGGPIELLACTPRGKTHESVFALNAAPKDLQVALLLLGLMEGRNPAVDYPEGSRALEQEPGDEVLIFVEWRPETERGEDEPKRRLRAERFLYNVREEAEAQPARWVFLGSRMVRGRFGAELEGSLITTFHDPLAVLELSLPTANDDIFYEVNDELCPPVGTEVELIIEVPPEDQEEHEPADEGESETENEKAKE
ncbi:MAG: YdjY domain-containing protein [Planctomycetota bacterium]